MAWYERTQEGTQSVRVLEVREASVWERVAQATGKAKPGRGRVRVFAEYPTARAAAKAARALGERLVAEGWTLVDPDAGVDRPFPRSRPPPTPTGLDAPAVERELTRAIAALGGSPTVEEVVNAFAAVLGQPLAIRPRGYVYDSYLSAEKGYLLGLAAQLRSESEGYWRELGLSAVVEVDEEHETIDEEFDAPGGKPSGFLREVRASDSFACVASCRCSAVELRDDEID